MIYILAFLWYVLIAFILCLSYIKGNSNIKFKIHTLWRTYFTLNHIQSLMHDSQQSLSCTFATDRVVNGLGSSRWTQVGTSFATVCGGNNFGMDIPAGLHSLLMELDIVCVESRECNIHHWLLWNKYQSHMKYAWYWYI